MQDARDDFISWAYLVKLAQRRRELLADEPYLTRDNPILSEIGAIDVTVNVYSKRVNRPESAVWAELHREIDSNS
jgi:hypothetical protein